jgi:DNA repair protein RadA/Sms
MEGTRPLIVEVQALVSETTNPNPKRSVNGFDYNRLNMLLALLEKKLDIPLNHYDVFINITGGIKISEAGSDLAILAAIISSFKNRPLSKKVIFIGEVSLIGDIRDVGNMEIRLKEALSQKIEKAIISKSNIKQEEMQLFFIDEVSRLLDWI